MKTELPPIHSIRGCRVMLDRDLARLYDVPTVRFNQAIKRNAERFPQDFRFQLTREEYAYLISQFVISSSEIIGKERHATMSSQIAMSSLKQHGGLRKLPWVFTDEVRQHEDGVVRRSRTARGSPAGEAFGCPLGKTTNNTARLWLPLCSTVSEPYK